MPEYFEFQDVASHKFWEVDYDDDSVIIRFGKVGTPGQISEKKFDGPMSVLEYVSKAISGKIKKGYVRIEKKEKNLINKSSKLKKEISKEKENEQNQAIKKVKVKSADRIFYGNMNCFEIDEQPKNFNILPDAFKAAYDLWKKTKKSNNEITELLSPFICAKFIPLNIVGWEELFIQSNEEEFQEYDAIKIKLVGVDFSTKPIPSCRAEAWFKIPTTKNFSKLSFEDLEEWQENNDYFYSAISFGWEIPGIPDLEDLDLWYSKHSGCECVLVEKFEE
jgi:predicted DNA-binding WGR domain protein